MMKLFLFLSCTVSAFVSRPSNFRTIPLFVESVEVCGGKDCKRAGGGARLEKLVNEVVEEQALDVTVEGCDCQGECGYGPNLLVDGKIVNSVRGKEAVLQALGIEAVTES